MYCRTMKKKKTVTYNYCYHWDVYFAWKIFCWNIEL